MELLLCLLKQPQDPAAEFRRRMKENYKIEVSEAEEISVINNLSFDFLMPKDRETLGSRSWSCLPAAGGACRRLSK